METIPGKFCPICKFKNEVTAITCTFCGASLENVTHGERTTKRVEDSTKYLEPQIGDVDAKGITAPIKGIAIYHNRTLVAIREEDEFYVGRKFEENTDALLDLGPFGAIQMGVSRKHAIIRKSARGYDIVDLGSTNGTFLDGNRLVSNKPYALSRSAAISLGRLPLLFLYGRVTTKEKTKG